MLLSASNEALMLPSRSLKCGDAFTQRLMNAQSPLNRLILCAHASNLFHRVMDLSRRVVLINLAGGKKWLDDWCGLEYQPVLFRTLDGRWFCARSTIDGYQTPPNCPRDVEFLELNNEQALFWFKKHKIDAPPDLIEAIKSLMGGSNVSQVDRPAEAPNLTAVSKPDPGPQATPQLKAAPSTNEAQPLDEAPAQPGNNRKRRKEPKPWELEAYKLCEMGKYTQKEIAEMLSREFHIPLDQSEISKAKDRVAAWKGEPKPARVPKENRLRKHNVDPQKLQNVVEAGGPTLAEQIERGPAPLGNRMRTRRREND